jgi:hypothetical protein
MENTEQREETRGVSEYKEIMKALLYMKVDI